MKYVFKISILLLIPILGLAQSGIKSERYIGFEIFLVEDFKLNEKSYAKFTNKQREEFLNEYKDKKGLSDIPDSLCMNYIDLKKIKLNENPFLESNDIEYYDKQEFTIVLTESGTKKMKKYKPNLFGSPFIIVANSKMILSCWFRPSYSSQIVDRIYVTTNEIESFDNEGISEFKTQSELKLGFIGCGTDLRNNNEFINELKLVEE